MNQKVLHNIYGYRALARKYRPKLFNHIVSQSHIIRIIKNSIEYNRIHHAYIFSGIRGVGKTTLARIFSKGLNCIKDNNKQPIFDPCLKCRICLSIDEGRNQDVLEIDAASNTGIADIKDLIENSKYNPISTRYKIYIIDEVHMLSNSAFNGLLKILEDPPIYAKFILATTEIKKIPLTVLSRCQRFDLHRLTIPQLSEYLEYIAKKENFKINKDASILISKSSQGSVREALSLLDQAIISSHCSNLIELSSITQMLGIINAEYIYMMLNWILKGDIKNAINIVRELYLKGAEPATILRELAETSYKVTLYKIGIVENLFLSDFEDKECSNISTNISVVSITRLWQMFNKALTDMKMLYGDLITLEMNIIKISYANLTISPEKVLESLNKHPEVENFENDKKKLTI